MKKLALIALLAILSFCSDDSEIIEHRNQDLSHARLGDTLPRNSDNAFDLAGKIHNDLLSSYYSGVIFPATTSEIAFLIDSLALWNIDFALIKGSNYAGVNATRVDYLVTPRDSCVTRVINSSSLSVYARSSLKTFVENLQFITDDEKDYEPIYHFIAAYEADVLGDTSLTPKDKEVILITTSIARFSVYAKKKRPKKNEDPDWAWLTANIMVGADGADIGLAEAVSHAVVAGIVDNK